MTMMQPRENCIAMSGVPTIELLGTSGCHLCDEARLIVIELIAENVVQAIYIDIADHDDSDALIARYGWRLPVLRDHDRELDWPFTRDAVLQWLLHHPVPQPRL